MEKQDEIMRKQLDKINDNLELIHENIDQINDKMDKTQKWIEDAKSTLGCLSWAVATILIIVSHILFAIK